MQEREVIGLGSKKVVIENGKRRLYGIEVESKNITIDNWSDENNALNDRNFVEKEGKLFLLVVCSEIHNKRLFKQTDEVLSFVGNEDFGFNTFTHIAGEWGVMTSDEVLLEEVKRKIETKGNDAK